MIFFFFFKVPKYGDSGIYQSLVIFVFILCSSYRVSIKEVLVHGILTSMIWRLKHHWYFQYLIFSITKKVSCPCSCWQIIKFTAILKSFSHTLFFLFFKSQIEDDDDLSEMKEDEELRDVVGKVSLVPSLLFLSL